MNGVEQPMADSRPQGVAAEDLADGDLDRELKRLHETRHDVVLGGTADALETHTRRMLELEAEYIRRFPDKAAPDPGRLRPSS
jgi:hypothetical protein